MHRSFSTPMTDISVSTTFPFEADVANTSTRKPVANVGSIPICKSCWPVIVSSFPLIEPPATDTIQCRPVTGSQEPPSEGSNGVASVVYHTAMPARWWSSRPIPDRISRVSIIAALRNVNTAVRGLSRVAPPPNAQPLSAGASAPSIASTIS